MTEFGRCMTAHVTTNLSANAWPCLRCPGCGSVVRESPTGAQCTRCRLHYPFSARGALDLRLQQPRSYSLTFTLGPAFPPAGSPVIEPLRMNAQPEVTFGDMPVPHHMTAELRSHIPRARSANSLMLDLGCGQAVHKTMCERAGFEWVGVDYDAKSEAAILGDVHSLPFAQATFECVLSVAAIHLFQYPFVAMREVHRVLKPGGVFLGTVAFLEPFHDGGFYHHTHLGVLNSLQSAGFNVEVLAPSEDWSVLVAQANMALFPKMPGFLARAIVYPVEMLHKVWWAVGRGVTRNPNAENSVRIRNTTGAFAFVARRAESPAVDLAVPASA